MPETINSHLQIPAHLKKYVVPQNYKNYTSEDQSVWRYIMRRLIDFLSDNAHPCYVDGLAKTGISPKKIPKIEEMNTKLAEFGWGALPVSGFIPPAAFMEFQSLGFLPIASDIRTVNHLLYTPAPDIVHETAGHAPILFDPAFARYLKHYAEIATKAIISKEDMNQYEAIRILSDTKEDPTSSKQDVDKAIAHLEKANQAITYLSEAAYLSRMNWWTAEYGLIGDLNQPKIFGAGLLSSVGESKDCLKEAVTKIPLTIHCLDYSYDITEPQPQLFVTPTFEALETVLEELANRMAFRQGGLVGLEKAHKAQTVNTVELNSGLQVSGVLCEFHSRLVAGLRELTYMRFQGPTQLSLNGKQLQNHGPNYHNQGFSSPIGLLKNETKCLSSMDSQDLIRLGIIKGQTTNLQFASGIQVEGTISRIIRGNEKIVIVSIENCTVRDNEKVLFDPSWGVFDMAVGSSVPSVFGGPADRSSYGDVDDFVAKRVPPKKYSEERIQVFKLYQSIRDLRESSDPQTVRADQLQGLISSYRNNHQDNWLMGVELVELAVALNRSDLQDELEKHLRAFKTDDFSIAECINEGLRLAKSIPCQLN